VTAALFCHDSEYLLGKAPDGDKRSGNIKEIGHIICTKRVGPEPPTHPGGNGVNLLVYDQDDHFFGNHSKAILGWRPSTSRNDQLKVVSSFSFGYNFTDF
jgi:hypothetical protein